MESKNVIYQNGQLIEVNTKEQVYLVPGKQYFIVGEKNSFPTKSYLEKDNKPLNTEEKRKQLKKKYPNYIIKQVLSVNTLLYFRVGLGKKTNEDKVSEYLFEARLLEDLYIRSKNQVDWTLCDCICESAKHVDGELPFNHKIIGSSLSNLFANVVVHYFNGKRSTATNAFDTFITNPKNMNTTLDWYKAWRNTYKLDTLRKQINADLKKF